MSDNTPIEWARHPVTGKGATWNPITGCRLVSEGCRHCYAARLAATRMKNHPSRKGLARANAAGEFKFTGEVRFNAEWLDQPLRWRTPRGIFVCAHGDLFAEGVPDDWIDKVFAVMALSPQHVFFVLTKRPERARAYASNLPARQEGDPNWPANPLEIAAHEIFEDMGFDGDVAATRAYEKVQEWPLPNVWLGTSIEDQATADMRIPELLATPAAIRFVSAEPLLGKIDLTNLRRYNPQGKPWINALTGVVTHGGYLARSADECSLNTRTQLFPPELPGIDWVIAGGESGPHARPMHPDWARALRDQCAAGVPFFMKQMGGTRKPFPPIPSELMIREVPNVS